MTKRSVVHAFPIRHRDGGRRAIAIAALAALLTSASAARAADTLKIGVSAWPSAQVTARIIARVAKRLGIEGELRELGSVSMLEQIATGKLDVYPEIWFPNLKEEFVKWNVDGTITVNAHGVKGEQNVCVTRKTQEQTGIRSLSDLKDPALAAKFDTDNDGKGEMWIGDPGWRSTQIEQVRAKSYGYADTMSLLQMPEEVAMAAVDVAASLGTPIVFYCYRPHHVFDLHEIVVLREPEYDMGRWHIVASSDPDWLAKSRAETGWDTSYFYVGYATSLLQRQPAMAQFLSNIAFESADIDKMTYAVQVDRKPADEVADEWIAANEERIKAWMQR
jgi:glycine betaine/proline transport system substrate-binding protein